MSALRVSLPGQPIRYIDLGPARGRISVNTSLGGPIEPRIVRRESRVRPDGGYPVHRVDGYLADPARIEHELAGAPRPTCGSMMPLAGEPCGRRPGHRDHHKTALAMQLDRERRRTTTWR